MAGRLVTLVVSGALVVVMAAAGWFLPVPYVREAPGPTYDTLGRVDGKQVVSVEGHKTYPVGGHLNMTTVSVIGGPGNEPSLGQILTGWVDPSVAVVPQEVYYPEGTTRKQIERQSTEQFQDSEDHASVAALRHVGVPVTEQLVVQSVQKGRPAQGKLRAGDKILRIGAVRTEDAEAVQKQMRKYEPGDRVEFTVRRKGKQVTVTIRTVEAEDGRAIVGIILGADYSYPVQVEIRLRNVGGPSAGLMFSLAIVDRLTPGKLTGGKFVAGTGTMDPAGKVGPIGGITQKMIAAKREGATVFLTPAANCAEARRSVPEDLRLVKVQTLDGAVSSLDALRRGQGGVPTCGP